MINLNTNTATTDIKKTQLNTSTKKNARELLPSHIPKNALNSDEQKFNGNSSIEKKDIKALNETDLSQQLVALDFSTAFQAVIEKNYYPNKNLAYNLYPYVLDIIYEIKSNLTRDENYPHKLSLVEVFCKTTFIGLDILKKMTGISDTDDKDSELCSFINSIYLKLIECINTYSGNFNKKNRLELEKLKNIVIQVKTLVTTEEDLLRECNKNVCEFQSLNQKNSLYSLPESLDRIKYLTVLIKKITSCFTDFIISKDFFEIIKNDKTISVEFSVDRLKTNYANKINLIDKKVKERIKQSTHSNYDHKPIQSLLNYSIVATKDISLYFSKVGTIAFTKKSPHLFRLASDSITNYPLAVVLEAVVNLEDFQVDSIISSVLKSLDLSLNEFERQICHSFSLAANTNGKVLDINAAYKLIKSFSSLEKTLNTYFTDTIPGLTKLLELIFDYVNDLNKLLESPDENNTLLGKFYLITRQTTVILEGIEESIIPNTLTYLDDLLQLSSQKTSYKNHLKRRRITLSRIGGVIKLLELFEQHARPLFKIVEKFSETMLIDKKVDAPEKIIVIDETVKETSTLPEPVIQKDIETKVEEPEITINDEKFLDEVDLQEVDSNLNENEYIKKIEETVVEIENCSTKQPGFVKNMKLRKLLKIIQAHGYKLDKKRGKGSHIQATKPGCPTLTLTGHKMVSPGVTEQNLKALEESESIQDKPTENVKQVNSSKELRTKKKKTKKNRPKRR